MNSITEHSNLGKAGKRDRGLTDYSLSCTINYAQAILKALTALFNNDTSNEFMDSVKFDSICPKIGNLFTAVGFGADYSSLVSEYLQPCLICLYKNTKDDLTATLPHQTPQYSCRLRPFSCRITIVNCGRIGTWVRSTIMAG